MKKFSTIALGGLFMGLLFLTSSCLKDKTLVSTTYMINQPIYLAEEDARQVEFQPAKTLVNPGKIYVYGNLLLINEKNIGIHLIDNTDPNSPQTLGFVQIPGNLDIAVREGVLYADSYTDLLALDLGNGTNVTILERFEDVFEYDFYSWDFDPAYPLGNIDHSKGIVIGWRQIEITEDCEGGDCPSVSGRGGWGRTFENDVAIAQFNSSGGGGSAAPVGVAGSLTRFIQYDHYLYTISSHDNIKIYDVMSPASPTLESEFPVGRDIETLFTTNGHLFIGAQTGMYIYSLAAPASPEYVSTFLHVRSCDPVVVHGNYAYVTLRGGGNCGQANDELLVIDISDLSSPRLMNSHPMSEPFGLGVDTQRDVLFLCDGDAGLKVYDISSPLELIDNRITHLPEMNAYDVIVLPGNGPSQFPVGTLMMIGADGFVQYDYSDLANISELSRIPVVAN